MLLLPKHCRGRCLKMLLLMQKPSQILLRWSKTCSLILKSCFFFLLCFFLLSGPICPQALVQLPCLLCPCCSVCRDCTRQPEKSLAPLSCCFSSHFYFSVHQQSFLFLSASGALADEDVIMVSSLQTLTPCCVNPVACKTSVMCCRVGAGARQAG